MGEQHQTHHNGYRASPQIRTTCKFIQEINPNIPFDEAAPRDLIVNTTEKERLKKVQIKVDLTIESFYLVEDASSVNHLGIMATNSMKEWIAAFPSLHTVTIVLKDLLKRRDLNNIYKGTYPIQFRRNQQLCPGDHDHRIHAHQKSRRIEEPSHRLLWLPRLLM